MIAGGTYFTLLIDVQNSIYSILGTFIENIGRSIPSSGCRIRLATYSAYKSGESPKFLSGRYVLTGEEFRLQWSVMKKAGITSGIKRLDANSVAFFKSNGVERNTNKVFISSVNWSTDPSCIADIAPMCASCVEVQLLSPNNAKVLASLMRAHIKSRMSAGNVVMHDFSSVANLQELFTFNNPVVNDAMARTTKYRFQELFLLSDAIVLANGEHYDRKCPNLMPAKNLRFDHVKKE